MNEIAEKILALLGMKSAGRVTAGGGDEVMHEVPDQIKAAQADYRYHRHIYRSLLNLVIAEAILICLMIAGAMWIILTANPQDRFFVAAVDGHISRVVPLDTPTSSNDEMYVRVGTAVANAFSFGFLDYDQRRMEVAPIFEPDALNSLLGSFLGSGGTAAMAQENRIYKTSVEPSRPGGVVDQGVVDHIYHWVISVPLSVITKTGPDGSEQTVTPWTVVVNVERAKAIEATRGFMITGIISATPDGRPQKLATGGSQ